MCIPRFLLTFLLGGEDMSKKDFDSVDELYAGLLDDIQKTVAEEIANEMIKIEQEVIEEEVYAQFTPKEYQRRYHNGGIISKENMETMVSVGGDSVTIEVMNITRGNPESCPGYYRGYIQPIIEEGDYIWNGEMPPPRPFIDPTQGVIDRTSKIDEALDRALKKLGW